MLAAVDMEVEVTGYSQILGPGLSYCSALRIHVRLSRKCTPRVTYWLRVLSDRGDERNSSEEVFTCQHLTFQQRAFRFSCHLL